MKGCHSAHEALTDWVENGFLPARNVMLLIFFWETVFYGGVVTSEIHPEVARAYRGEWA